MNPSPRLCATIEARMTSTRLPGKVLMEAVGKPMLELMIERLRRVPRLDGIIIATTTNATDDPVVALAERLGVMCFRGSEHDVLARVLEAARSHDVDVIVETTGDCPLIDPALVTDVIDAYFTSGADYISNALAPRTFPVGMDTQVFSTDILADVASRTDDPEDHEHVSLFIYNNPDIYRVEAVRAPDELHAPNLRLTLDTPEDLKLIRDVFDRLYPLDPCFGLAEILALLLPGVPPGAGGAGSHT
jgi:spore coat polysaccharide biosynthesis protein SpsF